MSVFTNLRNRLRNQFKIRQEVARLKAVGAASPRGLECVFYAETKNDWIYFEGLILELIDNRDQPVVYLTSSSDDSALELQHKNFQAFYIGEGVARTMLFRSIECKLFLMTLTDLDQLFLQRSVHDVHYVYLFHAIVSAHMVYREKSFNAYDTFFSVGPHHARELDALHRFYGVDKKEVVSFGYYRLEKLLRDNAADPESRAPSDAPEILIAPSWGDQSITCTVLLPLIEALLRDGFRVTFRPHPMSFRRDAAILRDVSQRFGDESGVRFDFDIRNSDSLRRADLMISDWSGSAFEFAFGFVKPVLFVDTAPKVNNADFEAFNTFCQEQDGQTLVPIERSLRTVLGDTLSPEHVSEVGAKIRPLLQDQQTTRDALLAARDRTIAHLGTSSEVGASYIIDYLGRG